MPLSRVAQYAASHRNRSSLPHFLALGTVNRKAALLVVREGRPWPGKHMRMCGRSTADGSRFESGPGLHWRLVSAKTIFSPINSWLTAGKDRPPGDLHPGGTYPKEGPL